MTDILYSYILDKHIGMTNIKKKSLWIPNTDLRYTGTLKTSGYNMYHQV